MRYCLSAAVLDGSPVLSTFEDTAVERGEAQGLLRRVEMVASPAGRGDGAFEVAVMLRSGDTVSERCAEPRGGPSAPLTWDELAAKFRDCATGILGPATTDELLGQIECLDRVSSASTLLCIFAIESAAVSA